MVDREGSRPPYQLALDLLDWARRSWADVDGRAMMAGLDLARLPVDRALNVITTLAVDDVVVTTTLQVTENKTRLMSREQARRDLFEAIAGTGRPASVDWNPGTWGLLPEHQAATRAAIAMLGGPAPLKPAGPP